MPSTKVACFIQVLSAVGIDSGATSPTYCSVTTANLVQPLTTNCALSTVDVKHLGKKRSRDSTLNASYLTVLKTKSCFAANLFPHQQELLLGGALTHPASPAALVAPAFPAVPALADVGLNNAQQQPNINNNSRKNSRAHCPQSTPPEAAAVSNGGGGSEDDDEDSSGVCGGPGESSSNQQLLPSAAAAAAAAAATSAAPDYDPNCDHSVESGSVNMVYGLQIDAAAAADGGGGVGNGGGGGGRPPRQSRHIAC